MRVAVMQPYFFPYPGYFQLIKSVDKFVVLDNVQYINRGWINRNRILLNNKSFNIVLPVKKDSREKKINERYFVEDSFQYKKKLLRQIEYGYAKAPFFKQTFPLITSLINIEEKNVSIYNTMILRELCHFLNIITPFNFSSEINVENDLTGEDKIIRINEINGSTIYINLIGGRELYHKEAFLTKGIDLKFLKTEVTFYKQFDNYFVPNLSILDLIMFNSIESANKILDKFQLI